MIRTLLASTAIATLVATGAYAQMAPTTPAQPGAAAPAEAPMVKQAEGHLASKIIGETVYNGTGDDAQNIGSVNDIVIGPDGQIEAIVVGVGGFLGIGQKNVALEFDLAQIVERDNDEWIVVETSQEALEALPEFDLAAYEFGPADGTVGETRPATAADLNAAPADGAATQDTAAAPAAPATDSMAAAPATTDGAATQDTAAAPATTDGAATQDTAAAPADQNATTEGATQDTAQAPAGAPEAETDATRTAAIDRSTLNEVALDQIRTEDFVGTTVYGANDENVGEVGDIVMSADGGSVDAIILDVGGFLGIGEKEVAVGLDNLSFMTDADGEYYLYTNLTKEQLEAQPAYDEAGYAANRDSMRMVVPN